MKSISSFTVNAPNNSLYFSGEGSEPHGKEARRAAKAAKKAQNALRNPGQGDAFVPAATGNTGFPDPKALPAADTYSNESARQAQRKKEKQERADKAEAQRAEAAKRTEEAEKIVAKMQPLISRLRETSKNNTWHNFGPDRKGNYFKSIKLTSIRTPLLKTKDNEIGTEYDLILSETGKKPASDKLIPRRDIEKMNKELQKKIRDLKISENPEAKKQLSLEIAFWSNFIEPVERFFRP